MAAEERSRPKADVLERGHIFFFYRPRVRSPNEDEHPEGAEDLERIYMVLHLRRKDVYRLLLIGRKRLPEVTEHERFWGFVDLVADDPREIEERLGPQRYLTRSRGERVRPAARPAGEGVYVIARHDDHTHLAYALELPRNPGEVQKELRIHGEASYVVTVKNPEALAPPEAGPRPNQAAKFPKRLQEKFEGRRFLPVDPPDFLDYCGAEILFIGAEKNVCRELGLDLLPEHETKRSAEIFRTLHVPKSEEIVEPLFRGRWQ